MRKRLCANGDCQETDVAITMNYWDDERPAFCSEECAVEWLQRRIEVKDRNADARRAQSYLATGPLVRVEDMTPPVRVVMTSEDDDDRLDQIAKSLGLRGLEDITCESNEGAPDGYGWGAWVGDYEPGCTVGTGRTPHDAIEDLLSQLAENAK